MVMSSGVDWATGLPTHAALFTDLALGPPRQHLTLQAPPEYPAVTLDATARAGLAAQLVAAARPEWAAALATRDPDQVWAQLEPLLHAFHCRSGGAEPVPRRPTRELWRDEVAGKATAEGDAVTMALREAARRKRQLQQLLFLAQRAAAAAQARSVWRALRRQAPPSSAWFHRLSSPEVPASERVAELVQLARCEEDLLLQQVRQARRQAWHRWVAEAWSSDQRRLYRWIREGARPPVRHALKQRADGTWQVGLQGQVEEGAAVGPPCA